MSTKKTKKKQAKRSVHDKELAEIARDAFWRGDICPESWDDLGQAVKVYWRAVARSVLEEAIYRVEANIK